MEFQPPEPADFPEPQHRPAVGAAFWQGVFAAVALVVLFGFAIYGVLAAAGAC
jgi:hypothetical protein